MTDTASDPLNSPWIAISRNRMLQLLQHEQIDPRVIDAMRSVPRERFVASHLVGAAYDDRALPIGEGQTISQPLMVALMLQAMQVQPDDHVLEVGTGSGYAAAVLSRLALSVVTVERIEPLALGARDLLARMGYDNVQVEIAGDVLGWPARAPYDAILVSAGAPHIPRTLLDQLAPGGRLVVPTGTRGGQELVRVTRTPHGDELARLGQCAFVPLIGDDAWNDESVNGVSGRPNVR